MILLRDCIPHLLYEFQGESELVKAIEELSEKFTTHRDKITDYLSDPRLVSAYTAFYLTTNHPKFREVIKWLPDEWLEELKHCDFVDLGAGPGTMSLAFRDWRGQGDGRVVQIETSKLMREQGQKLWSGLYPGESLTQLPAARTLSGSFLLFGHSANEMGASEAIRYIEQIDPAHVLFIEPGTKSFFREMLEIRRHLLNSGYHVLFPCPASEECPMDRSGSDWCHQFIEVRHSLEVERLSQLVRKDRKLLPLTVHAYSRTFKHQDKERIVRVHPSTKFSFEWEVCLGEQLEHYQVFRRGLDKKAQNRLDEVLAGDSVDSMTDKVLERGKRVRVLKINNKDLEP